MNPAALKSNLDALEAGSMIVVNDDAFNKRNLTKAGYESNPLEDGSLAEFRVHRLPMTSMTVKATEGIEGVSSRDGARAKNLFAVGVLSWMYGRPVEVTEEWIERKFAKRSAILAANLAAFHAGYNFGETTELLDVQYRVKPAALRPGTYRNVDGTAATALGLITASVTSGLQMLFASYPITPASELLHELARQRSFGVRVIQAEDEIAAANMALGASFGGQLGVTATSGPGMDLKAETIGLAVALELPMVIIDVQRAGPLDRHADQARVVGLADGALRPPWRVAAAGDRRGDAGALLRRGARGRSAGSGLPHARDPPLGRVPRQLLGAVADSRRRGSAANRPALRRGTQSQRRLPPPTCATSASPAHGRSPARSGSPTGSAAWRRKTAQATSATRPRTMPA